MENFYEKLEEANTTFLNALKKFNEETTPPILEFMASQTYLADEFRKANINIKVAC